MPNEPRTLGSMKLAAFPLETGQIRPRSLAPPRAMTTTATRRLTAIVAADVAGYARLMGADEEGRRLGYARVNTHGDQRGDESRHF